jgi:acyl-CoA synthetase (AMP-forming)/AMP-acid ligase II
MTRSPSAPILADDDDPVTDVDTLADLLAYRSRISADRIAFIAHDGARTSYGVLDHRARQVAAGLRAAGVGHGERIAYLGRNGVDYYEILFGAARLGAVFMPLNWRLADRELAWLIEDAGVRVIFGEADQLARVELHGISFDRAITIDCETPSTSDYAGWRDAQDAEDCAHDARPDGVAMQLYTSGTTGRPKGAMLSHRNLLALRTEVPIADQLPWYRWAPGEVSLLALPLFHIGTAAWGLIGLHHGRTLVVQPEFDAGRMIEAIVRHRVTRLAMVPSALQMLIEHPSARDADFSSVRFIFYGASPMPLPLLQRAMATIGGDFVQIYGMTETTGSLVALPPEDHVAAGGRRMLSAGKAFPGVELAIRNADGHVLPDGTIGEVMIRSPSNMIGYHNRPEATAETIDADGWLRSGDAGYIEDGYLFIHDRIKEMIITGGENVYPAEVEAVIHGHPDVADVAVIGVPDDRWGEAVKAVVALTEGAQPDEAGIIAWARARIAAFKAPRSVDFVPSLPRNPSGKLLRREVRAPYWRGRERPIG